jgi:hypothetical protein
VAGGYRDSVDFGAADPNVSFGRYIKSTGASDFTAMSTPTRDGENAYPKVGPVVINEIMYNPFGLDREYVELRNITDADVSLAGWTLSDGINYTFGADAVIPADGYLLVVPIDPSVYRSTYNVPAGAVVVGPYTGALNNGGENLTLSKPGTPVGQVTPLITVDRVNYDNNAPWPTSPDGTGPSLGRISAIHYGNDVANWQADAQDGTGGAANAFAPQVFSGGFIYGAGPTITIKFSKDVGDSLNADVDDDLSIVNLTTGQTLDPHTLLFNYDSVTQTATWQLPNNPADGNYRATLSAGKVTDGQGRTLDANGDGVSGDDFSEDFFYLAGDTNHDRTVGFADLVAVAQNYGASGGKTYEQGDLNFDGTVSFADLVLVAQHYGTSLAPPTPPAAPALIAAAAPLPAPVLSPPATGLPGEVSAASSEAPVLPANVLANSPALATVETGKKPKIAASVPPIVSKRAKGAVAGSKAIATDGKRALNGVPVPLPPAPFAGFGRKKIADVVYR